MLVVGVIATFLCSNPLRPRASRPAPPGSSSSANWATAALLAVATAQQETAGTVLSLRR
jgi:hypothetical protein